MPTSRTIGASVIAPMTNAPRRQVLGMNMPLLMRGRLHLQETDRHDRLVMPSLKHIVERPSGESTTGTHGRSIAWCTGEPIGRILTSRRIRAAACPHHHDRRPILSSGNLNQGDLIMSVTETLKPPPTHLLDGVPPDKRVVIIDVTWDDYESLVEQIGESRNCRVAFDGKDIEMMTLGPFHERQKSLLDWFIMIVASELKVERQPMGSTTWKRKKLKRAIESDVCYYFDPAKLAAAATAAHSDDVDLYPNPDLAAEVDISPPRIDRPGIYAALQVPEFWRVRNKAVSIEQLGPDGKYHRSSAQPFLTRAGRGCHPVGVQRGFEQPGRVGGTPAPMGTG